MGAEASELSIVYEDDYVLIVNKAAGMLAQEDYSGDQDVVRAAKAYLTRSSESDPFVGLVHRLDRETSGLMILARTPEAAADLSEQFRGHHPEKAYLAIVEGELTGLGVMEDYLLKDREGGRVVSSDHPEGKFARLRWMGVAYRGGTSLLHIQLETGRSHQIRVQMAERGHPVVGDARYGSSRSLACDGIALHAYRLVVDHPTSGRGMQWTSAPPSSWPTRFRDEISPFVSN